MSYPRTGYTSVPIDNDLIWIVGGLNEEGGAFEKRSEVFDGSSESVPDAELPASFVPDSFCAAAINGSASFIGGFDLDNFKPTAFVHYRSEEGGSWTEAGNWELQGSRIASCARIREETKDYDEVIIVSEKTQAGGDGRGK